MLKQETFGKFESGTGATYDGLMADTEHEVVEFLDGDVIKLGLVLKQSASRIQVTDQHGKQHSLNSRQVLLHHSIRISSSFFPEFSKDYLDSVKAASEEIDTELLWESMDPKGLEFKAEKAAEIYFSEIETKNLSAVIRAAFNDPLHFKRKGQHITVRTEDQVEEQEHVLKKKAEKENLNNEFTLWAEAVLNANTGSLSHWNEEFIPLLNKLEQALTNPEYKLDPWLQKFIQHKSGPFRSRPEVIVMLLVAGKRLPEGADPFILESGLPLEFSEAALQEAFILKESRDEINPASKPCGLVFSIDDEDTDEIDDAISFAADNEGFVVGIHIADASDLISVESRLDREASERSTSVYLPHRHFRMLPEELSCDLASLKSGNQRQTLSCYLRVSPSLEIENWEFSVKSLDIGKNLTYDQADSLVSQSNPEEADPDLRKALNFLDDFTISLLNERTDNGAVIIHRPELKITAGNKSIEVKIIDSESRSRRIISELMILYNRLAASLAAGNGSPFIFRGQKRPEGETPELPKTGYDNFAAFKLFAMMTPGTLSLSPENHFGLGVESYSQVTSPIRRYSDLLNQRQLKKLIHGESPVYSSDELAGFLPGIEKAEKRVRKLERRMNRLFILRYLTRKKKESFDLVVLQALKDGFLVETVKESVRGLLRAAEAPVPGARLQGKIEKVDPEGDTLVFTA